MLPCHVTYVWTCISYINAAICDSAYSIDNYKNVDKGSDDADEKQYLQVLLFI